MGLMKRLYCVLLHRDEHPSVMMEFWNFTGGIYMLVTCLLSRNEVESRYVVRHG